MVAHLSDGVKGSWGVLQDISMSIAPQINWPGKSGTSYAYYSHPIGTDFVGVPGNYIYARETSPGRWTAMYVGETQNLGDRLSNHEKESCAVSRGATHIHVHQSSASADIRRLEESDLIANLQPACNEVGVRRASAW